MWRVLLFLCGLLWAAVPRHAGAQGVEASPGPKGGLSQVLKAALTVKPGATCLRSERLLPQVRGWLDGRSPRDTLRIAVVGDAHDATRVHFELQHGERHARRAFADAPAGCAALHALLGLAIAMAIDATVAPLAPPSPADGAQHPSNRLSVQLAAASELLPGLSLGLQVEDAWQALPWLGFRAGVFFHHTRDARLPDSTGRYNASLLSGHVGACGGGQPQKRVRLGLCLGPALGALHVRGQGYAPNQTRTGVWLGVRAGVRLELHWGLHWLLDVEVFSPVLRPRVQVGRSADAPIVHDFSAQGLGLALGAAFETF